MAFWNKKGLSISPEAHQPKPDSNESQKPRMETEGKTNREVGAEIFNSAAAKIDTARQKGGQLWGGVKKLWGRVVENVQAFEQWDSNVTKAGTEFALGMGYKTIKAAPDAARKSAEVVGGVASKGLEITGATLRAPVEAGGQIAEWGVEAVGDGMEWAGDKMGQATEAAGKICKASYRGVVGRLKSECAAFSVDCKHIKDTTLGRYNGIKQAVELMIQEYHASKAVRHFDRLAPSSFNTLTPDRRKQLEAARALINSILEA